MTADSPRYAKQFATAAYVLTVGAGLAFLLGYAGRQFWLLDLLAHFRIQYAVVLAVCGLALLTLRRVRAGALVLACSVGVVASIASYTGWPSQRAQAATTQFRFVTFNRYFGNDDFATVGEWLQRVNADVVALQEVNSLQTVQQLAARLPAYPHVYAQPNVQADVVIFSRWPIANSATFELVPGGSQVAKVVIDWNGRPVTLIGVHLHWPLGPQTARFRDAELRQLALLARATPGPLLIGGDFNVTPWSPVFRDAVAASGLSDCARGQGLVASWPSFFPPAAIRIDHCLASDDWRVANVTAGPSLGSDHRAMVNDLELVIVNPRGVG